MYESILVNDLRVYTVCVGVWFTCLSVEFPPLPVTEEEVFADVSLKNSNCKPARQENGASLI